MSIRMMLFALNVLPFSEGGGGASEEYFVPYDFVLEEVLDYLFWMHPPMNFGEVRTIGHGGEWRAETGASICACPGSRTNIIVTKEPRGAVAVPTNVPCSRASLVIVNAHTASVVRTLPYDVFVPTSVCVFPLFPQFPDDTIVLAQRSMRGLQIVSIRTGLSVAAIEFDKVPHGVRGVPGSSSELVITFPDADQVVIFNVNTKSMRMVGSGITGSMVGDFLRPCGLCHAPGSETDMVVCEVGNNRIQIFSSVTGACLKAITVEEAPCCVCAVPGSQTDVVISGVDSSRLQVVNL